MHQPEKNQAAVTAKRKPGKPIYACMERRTGWSAALPIYMLCCPNCGNETETYPAGYGRIRCDATGCGFNTRVTTWPRLRDKTLLRVLFPVGLILCFFLTAFISGAATYHLLSK